MNSAEFYHSEAEREVTLRSDLRSLISGDMKWQEKLDNGSAQPDGVWIEEHFAYIIAEIENESGSAGDPILQGLIVHPKILTQGKVCITWIWPVCLLADMPRIAQTVYRTVKHAGHPACNCG